MSRFDKSDTVISFKELVGCRITYQQNERLFVNTAIRLNLQKSPESTENFDSQFRKLSVKMSTCDIDILANLEGSEFSDFDYVNPYWATKDVHDKLV